jgi:tetratricopeptide (TPR) repeat protein
MNAHGRRILRVLVLVLIVCAACAKPRPVAPVATPARPVDDVAALIRHGCYRCLEQAYAKAVAIGAQPLAFEAAALLTLRSKELGLPAGLWLDRARAIAATDSTLSLYVTIVEVISPDPLSDDREALFNIKARSTARASLATWREALRSGPTSDLFRAYLDVSLVCAFGELRGNEQSFTGVLDPVAEAPLYQYRVGTCSSAHMPRLTALRAGDPDFVDADLALGRYAIDDSINPNQEEGLKHLQSAAAAFPQSPVISTTIGNLYRRWEEWALALQAYDVTLAISAAHPEALIGRAVSLSHLLRSPEAIATATRVIDAGQWHLGEAYYWRGWNQLRLGNHDLARSDADRAKTLMSNAAVFVLSGVIEWRLRRLDTAEQEFQQALTIDFGECEAAYDLGVVRDERGKSREALAAFQQARQCYELSMAVRREAIAKVRAGSGTEATKARDAARHERELADLQSRHQETESAIRKLSY